MNGKSNHMELSIDDKRIFNRVGLSYCIKHYEQQIIWRKDCCYQRIYEICTSHCVMGNQTIDSESKSGQIGILIGNRDTDIKKGL